VLDGRLAVGMVFLPRTDYAAQERCRCIVESEILRGGFYIYGWRQVPVDTSVIGEKANATRPEIEQIMLSPPPAWRARTWSAPSSSAASGSRSVWPRPTSSTSTSARCRRGL
jgi:glutamate synthase domain-containing protein 1